MPKERILLESDSYDLFYKDKKDKKVLIERIINLNPVIRDKFIDSLNEDQQLNLSNMLLEAGIIGSLSKKMIGKLIGKAGSKAALDSAVNLGTKELVKNAAEAGTEELAKKSAEELAKKGAEKGTEELAKKGAEKGAEELAKKGAEKGTEELAKKGAEKGAEELSTAEITKETKPNGKKQGKVEVPDTSEVGREAEDAALTKSVKKEVLLKTAGVGAAGAAGGLLYSKGRNDGINAEEEAYQKYSKRKKNS